MNGKGTQTVRLGKKDSAFTLIELMVVIAIIAILAALIIPAAGIAAAKKKIKRAQAELELIDTALDSYKSKRGFYPPDNPNNPALSPLFYELTGTVIEVGKSQTAFVRIHGDESIEQNLVTNTFGLGGFMNSSRVSSKAAKAELSEAEARDFFPNLKPGQYGATNSTGIAYLGMYLEGPIQYINTAGNAFSPWSYNISNPTNNPGSYDLWIDLIIRGKTNRVSNWSKDVQIL